MLTKILHVDDSPHRIALGVALAMFVAFLPLIGIQTAVAIGLAALFRANKAVCIPIVWITNPATMWPIYGGCVALGRWLTTSKGDGGEVEVLTQLAHIQQSASWFDAQFWADLLDFILNAAAELWIGCVVVGLVLAIPSYFISRWGVVHYRERHRQKILRRHLFRSQLKNQKLANTHEHHEVV